MDKLLIILGLFLFTINLLFIVINAKIEYIRENKAITIINCNNTKSLLHETLNFYKVSPCNYFYKIEIEDG